MTWTNAGGFHNVAFDDNSFKQPPTVQSNAWTVSRTFNTPGTFRYFCEAHGARGGVGMSGQVVVNAAGGSTPGGTTPAPPGVVPTEGPVPGSATPRSAPLPPTTSPPTAKERAKKRCRSRRKFTIRIREPSGGLRSARVSVNGKRTKVVARRVRGRLRQTAEVDLRGLPRGVYRVKITAVTTTGEPLRGTRLYRTCSRKRTPASLPRL